MTMIKSLASLFLTTSLMLTPMAALAGETYENTIQVQGQGRTVGRGIGENAERQGMGGLGQTQGVRRRS